MRILDEICRYMDDFSRMFIVTLNPFRFCFSYSYVKNG